MPKERRSNLRGTHRITWTLFSGTTGWDDFFVQARKIPGFVDVRADHYPGDRTSETERLQSAYAGRENREG